jgi:hypothetical protein
MWWVTHAARIDKVVPVLSKLSTKPQKRIGGVEVQLHALLTLAPDGGEFSASRPSRFTLRERVLGIHWIGGWVGPRAGLDR